MDSVVMDAALPPPVVALRSRDLSSRRRASDTNRDSNEMPAVLMLRGDSRSRIAVELPTGRCAVPRAIFHYKLVPFRRRTASARAVQRDWRRVMLAAKSRLGGE